MRWDRLFDDLEAQLDAADAAELASEVADRTRRERALVELTDRLMARRGQPVALHLAGGSSCEGVLVDVAQQWVVLRAPGPVLVPTAALTSLRGLGTGAVTTGRDAVHRRHSLGSVLRAVARDRSQVRMALVDATVWAGTLDAVGADYVDLAEHEPDEPRRPSAVRSVRTVPFAALAWVRPEPWGSSLV